MNTNTYNRTAEPLGKWAVRHPAIDANKLNESEVLEWARCFVCWSVFPFRYGTEADGSYVISDEYYRPICRKKRCGTVKILAFDSKVIIADERLLYGDEGPGYLLISVKRCFELIERLGIREEIRDRIIFQKQFPWGRFV